MVISVKCKKCNNECDFGDDLCLTCSKKLISKRLFLLGSIGFCLICILGCVFLGSLFLKKTLIQNAILDDLSNKYNENFDVTFLKKIKNTSGDFGIDGSIFFKFPAKGSTFYYKVYSPVYDIDFFSSYDTSVSDGNIFNNYEYLLRRREAMLQIYDTILNHFQNYKSGLITCYGQSSDVSSRDDMYEFLSRYNETYFSAYKNDERFSERLSFLFPGSMRDFVTENYEMLNSLNDALLNEKKNYLYFSVYFVTEDLYEIKFNWRGGEAYVFEQLDGLYDVSLQDYIMVNN